MPEVTKSRASPFSSMVVMQPYRARVRARGALDDLVQDGVEVEAGADAEDGGAELGDAVSQRLVLSPQIVGVGHDRLLRFIDSRKRPHVTK